MVDSVYALAGTVLLSGRYGSDSSLNSRLEANQMAITGASQVATQSANYVLPNLITPSN